jgi:hypothetical protein
MAAFSRRTLVVLAVACWMLTASIVAAPSGESQTASLSTELEALIAGRVSGHTNHDDGEWLQMAVTDAIKQRDRAIERLAIRAAFPLRARIGQPVSLSDSRVAVEIDTQKVLDVPRPVPYAAQIFAAVDGGDFVQWGDIGSGKSRWFDIDKSAASAATIPGYHSIRIRARLAFNAGNSAGWTEVRDLPPLLYAVYDGSPGPTASAVRALVEGPGTVAAREFDSALGDESINVWLANVLAPHAGREAPFIMWHSQYCSERTGESGLPPDPTAVCAVVDFQAYKTLGHIWFRTADVRTSDTGPAWEPISPPRFEGFVIRGSAPESRRLSNLVSQLDLEPAFTPAGDLEIDPDDIAIEPAQPKAGAPVSITVTVRNQGTADVFKALVQVVLVGSANDGAARSFVVDVPMHASVPVKLNAVFPLGYGIIAAIAMQETQHSPFDAGVPDPTPENACAYRIVNPHLAPPHFVSSSSVRPNGCPGRPRL